MDTLAPLQRSQAMRAVKSKNTLPEMFVRRMIHGMGFRYRLHVGKLPGTPDLVFPARRKIIQVNGCFWHQHQGCKRAKRPATNQEYWERKLNSNLRRDKANMKALKALGWNVMVVWECQTQESKRQQLAKRICRFLKS